MACVMHGPPHGVYPIPAPLSADKVASDAGNHFAPAHYCYKGNRRLAELVVYADAGAGKSSKIKARQHTASIVQGNFNCGPAA